MGSLGAIYRGYGNIEAILLGKQTNVILAVLSYIQGRNFIQFRIILATTL